MEEKVDCQAGTGRWVVSIDWVGAARVLLTGWQMLAIGVRPGLCLRGLGNIASSGGY